MFHRLVCVCCAIYGTRKDHYRTGSDALNESMPYVNVQVKGTTNGTITNIDGKFSISVPNSKSVLIFTFIGYSKQEIVVGNQAKINVQLKEDAQNLDEVVVVGYGTAKKSDLTGATASLRPDANDASKAVSIDGLLQGKIAGLNVTASMSTPGLLLLLLFVVLIHYVEIISHYM